MIAQAVNRPRLGRQIARNTVLGWAGRLVAVLGWTLIAPWMLHRLGAERFGLWSLLSVFSTLAVTFDLGLQGALTKFVAEYRGAEREAAARVLLAMALTAYVTLGVLTLLLVLLLRSPIMDFYRLTDSLREEAMIALPLAALATLTLNLSQYSGALLGGLHRLDRWSQIAMVGTIAQLGLSAWTVHSGGGVGGLLAVSASINLAVACAAAWITHRMAPGLRPVWSGWTRPQARRLGDFSVALQIISIGLLIQFQLDKILFGRWAGLASVAEYELAYRVVFALWTVPALLLPPLLPAVAHLHAQGDNEAVLSLFRRASRYVLAVALPLAAGIVVFSSSVLTAWLGPGHHAAAVAAATLGAVLGVNILTGVGSAIVRGTGRPGLEAEYFIVAAVLHVPLSMMLIPRLGFEGGLLALAVSGVVGSLWFVVRVHRALGLPLLQEMRALVVPPLAVAVVTGALGGLVAHSIAGDSVDRVRLAAAVAAGGVVLVGTAALLLLRVRFVSLTEIRSLLGRSPAAIEVAK